MCKCRKRLCRLPLHGIRATCHEFVRPNGRYRVSSWSLDTMTVYEIAGMPAGVQRLVGGHAVVSIDQGARNIF